jgi:hypothetical protein
VKHDTTHRFTAFLVVALLVGSSCALLPQGPDPIDQATLDAWSAPYRGWHYFAEPIIPSDLKIPGHEKFHNLDVPTVYQIPALRGA